MRHWLALAAIGTAWTLPTYAQETAKPLDCSTVRIALPPELAGWGSGAPLDVGMDTKTAADVMLVPGKGSSLSLHPANHLTFSPAPEKPGAADSFGGIVSFKVTHTGLYRVALSAGAWIDVVRKGKAIASVNHGHGPECSGVRKMVDFKLKPGTYLLQIAGNKDVDLHVMLAPLAK